MKIVCLGDSITNGLGVTAKNRWVSLVDEETDYDFVNKGLNGDTTSGMLSRFNEHVIKEQTDAVLIMGGLNDIIISESIVEYCKTNIFAMIHHARHANIMPVLGIEPASFPADGEETAIRPPIKGEWKILFDPVRVCEQHKNLSEWIQMIGQVFQVPVLDFQSYFHREIKNSGEPYSEYFLDGLHPNRKGHRLMADAVHNFLRQKPF